MSRLEEKNQESSNSITETVGLNRKSIKVSSEIIDKKLGKPSFFLFRHLEKDAQIML